MQSLALTARLRAQNRLESAETRPPAKCNSALTAGVSPFSIGIRCRFVSSCDIKLWLFTSLNSFQARKRTVRRYDRDRYCTLTEDRKLITGIQNEKFLEILHLKTYNEDLNFYDCRSGTYQEVRAQHRR